MYVYIFLYEGLFVFCFTYLHSASSRATEEFPDAPVPPILVSEKGSNKTHISKESSIHKDELDAPEGL